jgi:hypothetical protein
MDIRKQSSIASINMLPEEEKRRIYGRIVPLGLMQRFNLPGLDTERGRALMKYSFTAGSTDVELALYPELRFPDPLLYGHITDTISGQIHILLYLLNDPDSPRFNVDRMPDGSLTRFGLSQRNLSAEQAALEFGLAPGQVRRGPRLLSPGLMAFESFVAALGHELYFVEPLYYHIAVIFEKHGFSYQMGRRFMEDIDRRFAAGGDLGGRLDGSSPFRQPAAAGSIRLRSWAIHDGILGHPFADVTMYKRVGRVASEKTTLASVW